MRREIRVEGHLSETPARAFPELDHALMSDRTILFGPVVDDTHPYGLVARCQSLDPHLIEMRRLPE